ncbi:MAG: hypothetical protein DLM55_08590 [Acidimicrobiales bacterium]|nr:MAG: hypothetical protein DLM55_08590 [Acidimicrobiales bacterium]
MLVRHSDGFSEAPKAARDWGRSRVNAQMQGRGTLPARHDNDRSTNALAKMGGLKMRGRPGTATFIP